MQIFKRHCTIGQKIDMNGHCIPSTVTDRSITKKKPPNQAMHGLGLKL